MFKKILGPVLSMAMLWSVSCKAPDKPDVALAGPVADSMPRFDEAAMRKAIEPGLKSFATAFNSGDSAGLVNMYAPDGKLMPPNGPVLAGREAIGKLISGILKMGIKDFKDSTTAVYGSKENIIEEGAFFMKDAKGNIMDKGKYVEVWRQYDGQWKMVVDIFNSDLPAPKSK
jgi:uncharacterized protein (TIGR02246 family)